MFNTDRIELCKHFFISLLVDRYNYQAKQKKINIYIAIADKRNDSQKQFNYLIQSCRMLKLTCDSEEFNNFSM